MAHCASVLLFNADGKFAALLALPDDGRPLRFVLPFGIVEGEESPWDAAIRGVTNLTTLDMLSAEAFWQSECTWLNKDSTLTETHFVALADDWQGDAEVVDRKTYYPLIFWIDPDHVEAFCQKAEAEVARHIIDLLAIARSKGLLPAKSR